jgi:hypothetical protein
MKFKVNPDKLLSAYFAAMCVMFLVLAQPLFIMGGVFYTVAGVICMVSALACAVFGVQCFKQS